MSFSLSSSPGLIIVEASLSGHVEQAALRLIFDAGATNTLIRSAILIAVRYDPDASPDRCGDRQWGRTRAEDYF